MSAEENAGSASVEANTGDVTSPEVSTDVAAESKPEVTLSDHVTDDSSSPQSEAVTKATDTTGEESTTETETPTESPSAGTETPSAATEGSRGESTSGETATAKPSPAPRVVIVTGASSGLGLAVSKKMCAGKHDVILACRSEEKANRAIAKIRKQQPDASATYMQLDLADLQSIRTFVNTFRASGKKLSVLVDNAGVILNLKNTQLQYTKDNFELTIGTNHLGHFLLTNLLIDDLQATAAHGGDARIIVVTSSFHDPDSKKKNGLQPLDVDDVFLFKENAYSSLQAYKNSKLANLMFTYEFARQLSGTGVVVNAVDPGFMPSSELLRHSNIVQKLFARVIQHGLLRFRGQTRTCSQAAVDLCSLAFDDTFKGISGKYFQNGQESKSSDESMDEGKQKALWKLSGGYTHLEGFEPLTATRPRPPEPPVTNGDAADKYTPINDQEPPQAAAASEKTAADKTEAVSATENGEKAIEEKKPESTSDNDVARSSETAGDEVDQNAETSTPSGEQKTNYNEKKADDDDIAKSADAKNE